MSTDREGRPRVRPAIRRLAMIAFPIFVVIAAHSVWDYVELRRVAHELDLIRAKGEPFSYSAAVRPSGREASGSDDAGRYYLSAAILALRTGEIMNAYGRFGPLQSWLSGMRPQPHVAELADSAGTFLRDWRLVFELLDVATALPFYVFPPGTEYNYQAAGLSNLARLNAVRTLHAAVSGDGDAAVRSAIAGIRLRRAFRRVSFLVTADHQVPALLSLLRPSEAALQELERALVEESDRDFVADDLVRERARYLDNVARAYLRQNVPPGGPVDMLRMPIGGVSVFVAFWRPLLARDVTTTLREFAEVIDVARTPWPEKARRAQAELRNPEPTSPTRMRLFRRAYMPAVAYFRAAARPDALILDRSSRIAVAVERYRRAHQDALPATLNELVPTYLKAIPSDPLSGQPLRYRATSDAYMVYSIGPDGDDDGGMVEGEWRQARAELLKETPPSAAARFIPGADVGIRVAIRR